MALISVIVPVYNVYDYMDRCIRSVLNQTFKNFEIILVAGDSSDGSTEKCIKREKCDIVKIKTRNDNGPHWRNMAFPGSGFIWTRFPVGVFCARSTEN